MSLTIQNLNGDASFQLTFHPILPFPRSKEDDHTSHAFTILLDPWLCGRSDIVHRKFSSTRRINPACVSSILELPEPDIVIVSQNKSDHCHRETLTQLPSQDGKTIILAEPAASKTINSWKHFNKNKVTALPKWQEPRPGQPDRLHRITLPPLDSEGEAGEVTIAYMEDKGDFTGLHNAIGITYKAPTHSQTLSSELMTPPDTPRSSVFPATANNNQPLSVIFSPHGCSYPTISSYSTSHLLATQALPLTAFLHCFDQIRNTWYLGGQICNGFPGGLEIAQKLSARVWISAHDGDKEVKGFATLQIATTKFDREEVERVVSPRRDTFSEKEGTRAVVLEVGENIVLSRTMDFATVDSPSSAPLLDGGVFVNIESNNLRSV